VAQKKSYFWKYGRLIADFIIFIVKEGGVSNLCKNTADVSRAVVFFHYPYWALVSHGPEIFVVIPPTCFFFTVVMVKLKENVIIIYFEPKFIANDDLQMYSHIHT
jgi:hypothetical protein